VFLISVWSFIWGAKPTKLTNYLAAGAQPGFF